MWTVEKTSRKPNYRKDIEYGKVAEDDFLSFIRQKEDLLCFDVRGIREYQNNDIDFILTRNNINSLPSFEVVLKQESFFKVEVKLDSRALETGNLPYEVVSHSSSGWCITTKADFLYIVLTEKDKKLIKKRAWIDMTKWHEWCANRSKKKKISHIKSENGIVDLLCRIDDLEKDGVLKWIA